MKKMHTLSLCFLILFGSGNMLFGEDIHQAAQKGDIAAVRSFLEKSPNLINAVDKQKRTPLHYAVLSQNPALVDLLLSRRGDIKARELNGETPLHFAAYKGNNAIVDTLIQKGADLHAKNNMGQTPAFYAAMQGHLEVLENLVNRGAEVKIKDTRRWSPVLLASWGGHAGVAAFLLQKGVDTNAAEGETWAPLHAAAFAGHTEVCRILIENDPKSLNIPSRNGDTPLHWAIHRSHKDTVALLLEKGADLTIANEREMLPVHAAIDAGNTEILSMILNKNKKILNFRDKVFDRSLLHFAVIRGTLDGIRYLVEQGIDINSQDFAGNTPIELAAKLERNDIFEWLRSKGAKEAPQEELKITWLVNAGYMISTASQSVLIDAVPTIAGQPQEQAILRKVANAVKPFDRADLFLVTHAHLDHFDPAASCRHLIKNPDTVMVGHKTVAQQAELYCKEFEQVKNSLFTTSPPLNEHIQITANGIKITAIHMLHEGEQGDQGMGNLAFLFEIGGRKILHLGDAGNYNSTLKDFKQFAWLAEEGIDVAIVPTLFLRTPSTVEIVQKIFSPKHVVPAHYGAAEAEEIQKLADNWTNVLPSVIVLHAPLDTWTLKPKD